MTETPKGLITVVASNTATIAHSIIIAPTHSSTVNLYVSDTQATTKKPRNVSLVYKYLVVGLFLFAVGCLALQTYLGFAWPEPTTTQEAIIASADWGLKTGIGLVAGLLVGKAFPEGKAQ